MIEVPKNAPQEGEIYQHYKGDSYKVLCLALYSNDNSWMVVYKPLYEDREAEVFVRPLTDWREDVEWEGKTVERFVLSSK